MLPVVPDPVGAPVVFGKGVDATPRPDNDAIIELLRAPAAADPELTDGKDDCQDDTIRNERATHNKVRGTLPHVLALAEPQSRNATKYHLRPGEDGEGFAHDSMCRLHDPPDPSVNTLFEMQLEVDPLPDLTGQEEHQRRGESRVDVSFDELPATMHVTEEVGDNGDGSREDLSRDMPS